MMKIPSEQSPSLGASNPGWKLLGMGRIHVSKTKSAKDFFSFGLKNNNAEYNPFCSKGYFSEMWNYAGGRVFQIKETPKK